MKKLFLALAFLALGGCSTLKPVDTTDYAKAAFAAKAAYGSALVLATQYARLPRCGEPASPPLCSDRSVLAQMRKASDAADIATQAAEDAVRNLAGQPTLIQAAVTAAQGSVGAFKSIVDVYSKKGN